MPIIAVVLPTSFVYGWEIARGMIEAAGRRQGWSLRIQRQTPPDAATALAWTEGADVAVILPRWPGLTRLLGRRPAVLVCPSKVSPHPAVGLDDVEVGRLAADYLASGAPAMLAMIANRESWSGDRERGFRATAQRLGLPMELLPAWRDPDHPPGDLLAHLSRLPRPLGLFAGNDRSAAALQAILPLAESSVQLPHDLRLLGADDDLILCHQTQPALSSIRMPWYELGRQTIELVEAVLRGQHPRSRVLQPLGVAERGSSEVLASADPSVAHLARVVRQLACTGSNVAEVVTAAGLSRRMAERHFRRATGHSLLAEIHRVRLLEARRLLAQPDHTVAAVAGRCGFSSAAALATAFRRAEGMSPADFRRRLRRG